MSQRYATIIKDNDGNDVVSNIAQMEGAPPEVRSDEAGTTKVVKVADGVLIGMIKGGPVDAVGGYGFPEGSAGASGRSPAGVTRTEDAKAKETPKAAAKADAKDKA